MAKTEFEYILKEPISYFHLGEENLGFKIILKAPTAKHREYLIKLKQQFFKALSGLRNSNIKDGAQEAQASGDPEELSGSQILMMIYMSGIDMVDFQNIFRAFLIQGLMQVDDTPITGKVLLDKINQDDFEAIIGEYIASFLLSSWTGNLNPA